MAPSDILSPATQSSPDDGFVFATCFPASNAWLRRDVTRYHPQLRLAFSAPGLVTWKGAVERDFVIGSPVGVVSGLGIGRATNSEELSSLVLGCAAKLQEYRLPIALHVFHSARDAESTQPEDETLPVWLDIATTLRRQFPFAVAPTASGGPIIDVVHLRDKPGTYFVGWHRQRFDRPTAVGGVESKPLDPRAPSRAYSKAWELLRLGEVEVRRGDRVVELGAAPGGGTLAWLEQGASVTAVDPAEMAAIVSEVSEQQHASYRHVQKSAGEVGAIDLPSQVDYLYSDMNLAPVVVLRYVERICALTGAPQRALLMNLKVNDAKVEASLRPLLQRISSLAQRLGCEMRVAQLPSHRKEVGVVLRRTHSARATGRAKK